MAALGGGASGGLPARGLRVGGIVRVPGDKSISHRALLLAALAPAGASRVTGLLDSADVRSTAGVLRAMGAAVPELSPDMLVGGGPLRKQARTEAEVAGIRVVQSYGMSETCGGCVYDGVPLDGVALKIDADDQVLVSGPVLFDGYDGEPERTAEALRDGWFRTDDLGRLDEDGRLQITGRADDVVISGGLKVPAGAVERMLVGHPSVDDAAVVGVPDPEWGERVVAVVVTRDGAVTLEELRDLVEPRQWAPRRMLAVHGLPLLANGKLDRLAVRQWAADA